MMTYSYRPEQEGRKLILAIYEPCGNCKWKMQYPSFYEEVTTGQLMEDRTLIELKIMKSIQDADGLSLYLKQNGIISHTDIITK